jgi:hypothetical protein
VRGADPAAAGALAAEDPERLDAVLPGDLLALLAAPRAVADRHLVGADPAAQQLAGHLRLHAEAARADVERAVELDRHQLEAGLQVTDVGVEQHVRRHRDALVAHHVPEAVGAVAAEGAIAVDHGGPPVEHRVEQLGDVLRVVLQVGVEDDHVVALGVVDRRPDGRALAGVALVGDDPQARVVGPAEDLTGAVPAAVVDHDQLDLTRIVDRQCLLESIRDAFFLVVDRHEDRELHGNLHGGDNTSALA